MFLGKRDDRPDLWDEVVRKAKTHEALLAFRDQSAAALARIPIRGRHYAARSTEHGVNGWRIGELTRTMPARTTAGVLLPHAYGVLDEEFAYPAVHLVPLDVERV